MSAVGTVIEGVGSMVILALPAGLVVVLSAAAARLGWLRCRALARSLWGVSCGLDGGD